VLALGMLAAFVIGITAGTVVGYAWPIGKWIY
jgi:hypothetical protein